MTTRHCSQWRRYLSRFGEICIRRDMRAVAAFIPSHTPHVSVSLTRNTAALGLRIWRKAAR